MADVKMKTDSVDKEEQDANKQRITETLENFGISIKKIDVHVGPTVTLFEIVPVDGTRVNRIRNLEDDIALSLAAKGIRIIAPMPGRGTIGIEVANRDPQVVPMPELSGFARAEQRYQRHSALCQDRCQAIVELWQHDIVPVFHEICVAVYLSDLADEFFRNII